jgi:hypothetical protein
MKTLTGKTIQEVQELLLEQLPDEAYKPVPHATYLTEISSAYTNEKLTEAFGLRGMGWGVSYDEDSLIFVDKEAVIKSARFWYVLDDEEGKESFEIQVAGSSRNSQVGWAVAGAITACVSKGAAGLRFQEHIYKNQKQAPEPAIGDGKKKPTTKSSQSNKKSDQSERTVAEKSFVVADLDRIHEALYSVEAIPAPPDPTEIGNEDRKGMRVFLLQSPLMPGFGEDEAIYVANLYKHYRDSGMTSDEAIKEVGKDWLDDGPGAEKKAGEAAPESSD